MILYEFEGFTVDPVSQKVYCDICDKTQNWKWMQKKSIINHLRTKEHIKHLQIANTNQEIFQQNLRDGELESAHKGSLSHLANAADYAVQTLTTIPTSPYVEENELYLDGYGNEIMFTAGDHSQMEANIADLRSQMEVFEYFDENFTMTSFDKDNGDITITNVTRDEFDAGLLYILDIRII